MKTTSDKLVERLTPKLREKGFDPSGYQVETEIDMTDPKDYALVVEVTKMENLLDDCRLQLEYLNEKFGETGTTNALLAKLKNIS